MQVTLANTVSVYFGQPAPAFTINASCYGAKREPEPVHATNPPQLEDFYTDDLRGFIRENYPESRGHGGVTRWGAKLDLIYFLTKKGVTPDYLKSKGFRLVTRKKNPYSWRASKDWKWNREKRNWEMVDEAPERNTPDKFEFPETQNTNLQGNSTMNDNSTTNNTPNDPPTLPPIPPASEAIARRPRTLAPNPPAEKQEPEETPVAEPVFRQIKTNDLTHYSPEQLARAINLMVSPADLGHTEVMAAILRALDFTSKEVAATLRSGEKLDDTPPMLCWEYFVSVAARQNIENNLPAAGILLRQA